MDPTRPAVPTATRIAFGNETGGDRSIEGSEVIGYYLSWTLAICERKG
jgi:hypothetical protein